MKRKLIVAAVVVGAVWFGWWAKGFLDIDSCLDAGGRWEYNGGYCEGARVVQD